MLRLNQQFVQAWPEERIGSIILINHMWRTQEEIKKYGFNLYYQTVTVKQYELLISLESTLSNQLYNETIAQLGTYLVNKLEKHMFLIDERKKSINTQPIWFS